MLFNSFIFIFLFLPLVLVGYFTLGRLKDKSYATVFIIAASLYFYSYYELYFLLLIFASVIVNYCIGKWLQHQRSKPVLALGIMLNIALLGYFKYADFFIANVNALLQTDIGFLYLALPLGISFITFQQIAYLVDMYKREAVPASFLNYTLFITFFPQLIAGPIVNQQDVMRDYANPANKRLQSEHVAKGLFIFMIGLVKKVVIADTLAIWVDDGYRNYAELTFAVGWIVVILYMFQLYFDFSGYCDMAIGLALMFNIHLPINFNSPLKSRNIREFWRRWHMTLNRFLTKYIYYPLGGSRKGKSRTYINILIIFFISGFWHGAGWTFVIWGLLQGLATVCYNVFTKVTRIQLPYIVSWFITYVFIVLSFVYFRATSIEQAHAIFKTLFTPEFASVQAFVQVPSALFAEAASLQLFAQPMNSPVIILGALIVAMLISFFTKNSVELLERFTFSWRTIFSLQILTIVSLLRIFYVQKESVFIYFNF